MRTVTCHTFYLLKTVPHQYLVHCTQIPAYPMALSCNRIDGTGRLQCNYTYRALHSLICRELLRLPLLARPNLHLPSHLFRIKCYHSESCRFSPLNPNPVLLFDRPAHLPKHYPLSHTARKSEHTIPHLTVLNLVSLIPLSLLEASIV